MPFFSILLFGLFFLSGCMPMGLPVQVESAEARRPYVSEVELSEAKAYFAFAQFRMLIVDSRWDEAIAALERARAFDPESTRLQLTLAKAYLHNQQLDEGGRILDQLLRQDPDQIDGWELLAELRFYQERYPEAIAAFKQVLQKKPADEKLRLRLIAVYDQLGDIPKALAETNTLLGLIPDSLPGQLALARLQRGNRQTEAAIKTYRGLLLLRPGQLQVIMELGQLLESEQQVGEAIDLYRETINDNPELLAVYRQLARILILQQRYPEALSLLQQAHLQRPDDIQILSRIGLLQLSLEEYIQAEESFRKALQLQPDEPHSLYSLGMSLVGQQRHNEAMEVLVLIPPESEVYPEAVLQIGYLYRQEGNIERAIEVLQRAVKNGGRSVEAYYYLSAFLGEDNRLAAAGQAVRQGIENFPQETQLHYQLGVIYERMDDRQQALGEMEKVLEIEPKDADALNFIAYHYAELGENLDQALIQAQQALEQKQTSYIYDTLGWIYYRMQRFDAALEYLEKAISLDPDDPLIQEHMGDVYASLQRWSEAEQSYRKALALDETLTSASDKLQKLLKDHSE